MTKTLIMKVVFLCMMLVMSACNMIPDLAWLGLSDDNVVRTNKTELLTSQQDPISIQGAAVANMATQAKPKMAALSSSELAMQQHLREWQEMKPSIARLVALEAQVKELLEELKTAKNAQNKQAPARTNSGDKQFAVQLVSLTDKNIMRATWKRLSSKHPRMLGDLSPIYEEVSVMGKTYYRVKAGAFQSKSAAMVFCTSLKSASTSCFPAQNIGIAML